MKLASLGAALFALGLACAAAYAQPISTLPTAAGGNAGDIIPCTQGSSGPNTGSTKGCSPPQIVAAGLQAGEITSSLLAAQAVQGALGYSPLSPANNLSELASPSAARTALGLAPSASIDTTNASNITSGALPAGRLPALTGDATATAGTGALTLATVNGAPGACVKPTVNAKGLATACGSLASSDVTSALSYVPANPATQQSWTGQQYFGTGTPGSNYLKTYAYGDNSAPVVGLNTTAGAGVTGAARTSTNPGAGGSAFGGIFFGLADGQGALSADSAWAAYGECRRYPNVTGYCVGLELDDTNLSGSSVPINPYNSYAAGSSEALHLAAGGGCGNTNPNNPAPYCYNPLTGQTNLSSSPSSAALLMSPNGTTFSGGIVFSCGALIGTNCSSNTYAPAMQMYQGDGLEWWCPNCGAGGVPAANVKIYSSVDNSGTPLSLVFTDTGFSIGNFAGNTSYFAATGTGDGLLVSGGGNALYDFSNAIPASPTETSRMLVDGYGWAIQNSTGSQDLLRVRSPSGANKSVMVYDGTVVLGAFTVSTLPACASTNAGAIAYVTDAASPAYNTTLTGGSSTKTLGMCNGLSWTAH